MRRLRSVKGWQALRQHPHSDRLIPYWLRGIGSDARDGRAIEEAEFAGAFNAGYGNRDEDDLWSILERQWNPLYQERLCARVKNGSPLEPVETAALTCLLTHDLDAFQRIIGELWQENNFNRLVEIALTLAYFQRPARALDKYGPIAVTASQSLPKPILDIHDTIKALNGDQVTGLSDDARAVLFAGPSPSDEVRKARLALDEFYTLPVEADITWALNTCEDPDTCVVAVEAAGRRQMNEIVHSALNHKFAYVVARALHLLADERDAPLPAEFLALCGNRGSPVRKALVAILIAKPHPEHLPTLMLLAADKWSASDMGYGDHHDDFPIAQKAIAALEALAPLDQSNAPRLFDISVETTDVDVRKAGFVLLAKTDVASQIRLFDLAVQPGTAAVRSSAAHALLQATDELDETVIARISAEILATKYTPVAAALTFIGAHRATIPNLLSFAEHLAPNPRRKVFLILIVRYLRERDIQTASAISAMLPVDHPAIAWALNSERVEATDALIADLGDTATCAEVLKYIAADQA